MSLPKKNVFGVAHKGLKALRPEGDVFNAEAVRRARKAKGIGMGGASKMPTRGFQPEDIKTGRGVFSYPKPKPKPKDET